jgi:hypothetical protein
MASVATISVNFAQYNTSDFSPTQTSVKSVNPLTLAQYCQGTSTPDNYQGGFLKKTAIAISNTPPANPVSTNLWYNPSLGTGVFSIYDNLQWKNLTSINTINTETVTLTYNPTNGDLSANAEYLLSLINTLSYNMQNIGNYPYLEYAWSTTPETNTQVFISTDNQNNDFITVANLTALLKDTDGIAYIGTNTDLNGNPTNNTIRLLQGKYHIKGQVNVSVSPSNNVIVSLKNNTKNKIETSGISSFVGGTDAQTAVTKIEFETSIKVTVGSGEIFQIEVLPSDGGQPPPSGNLHGIVSNKYVSPLGNYRFKNSTPNFDNRVMLKIWKVG